MAGTITKRGDRTWFVRIDMDRDSATGKRDRHCKTIHGTRKDAEAYMHKVLTARDTNTWREPSAETVSAYLERWLKDGAGPRIAASTALMYRRFVDCYIGPAIGSRLLDKLSPLDVQGFYNDLTARGLGPAFVRRVHGMLHSALKQAIKWELLDRNPSDAAELPRLANTEMCALSEIEAASFLAVAAGDRHAVLWSFLLETGVRPGEALALRWQDLDFKAGSATVHRSLTWLAKGSYVYDKPKTKKSVRTIPLTPSLLAALKRHRARVAEERLAAGPAWVDDDLVFPTELGTPHRRENLSTRHLKPILKAAELPARFRMYDTRHTCATILLARGFNPKVVAERLGHASVEILLNKYAHVLPGMQEQATAALEALLYQGCH